MILRKSVGTLPLGSSGYDSGASFPVGAGLIPSRESEIPHAVQCVAKKAQKKKKENLRRSPHEEVFPGVRCC